MIGDLRLEEIYEIQGNDRMERRGECKNKEIRVCYGDNHFHYVDCSLLSVFHSKHT